MDINFNNYKYLTSKSTDLLPCNCENCGNEFHTQKKLITQELNHNRGRIRFCSINCNSSHQSKSILTNCFNCGKEISVKTSKIKASKSGNNFCSKKCATSYNQKHKTFGYNRSKLELYIERKLIEIYPNIEFNFNRRDIILSELDIYIPSLKLAFELNGIFHYEPIFGDNSLKKVQNNDNRKFQACLERGIELCIIDTSQQKYFKEHNSQKYLNIVCDIINQKFLLP